jgi:hypothetical protein
MIIEEKQRADGAGLEPKRVQVQRLKVTLTDD